MFALNTFFLFPHSAKIKFVVGVLWRNIQTWFICRPLLSAIRQAYRNLSPVMLAGADTRGSSNSQRLKLVSSLPDLGAFVKSNLRKAWHLLRWWIFALMFQRTEKCSVFMKMVDDWRLWWRLSRVGVSPELPWWFRVPPQFCLSLL